MTVEGTPAGSRSTRLARLYLLTGTVAACSILYELLLAQTLAALLGNSVMRYSITIGCFLGALGLGAILCKAEGETSELWRRLARVELGLSILGGAAVPLFYVFDTLQTHVYFGDGLLAASAWVPVLFLVATHIIILATLNFAIFHVLLFKQSWTDYFYTDSIVYKSISKM